MDIRFKSKTLTIENTQYFTDTAWLKGTWTIKVAGTVVQEGNIRLSAIRPGNKANVVLPIKSLDLQPGEEAFMMISFVSAEKTPWCPNGHEVAWEQFSLGKGKAVKAIAGTLAVTAKETEQTITIAAGAMELVFSRTKGALTSCKHEGVDVLVKGPQLNVWRAATDNDGIKRWSGQQSKPLGKWLTAGIDKLTCVKSVAELEQAKNKATVKISQTFRCSNTKFEFEHVHTYTILGDGKISVTNQMIADKGLPELPRLGVTMQLIPGMEQFAWFGCGPHESYCDRKAGAPVDLYQSTVDEQYVPYILPQEHGNKVDVRWMSISNGTKTITFRAHALMECSASHFTADDLYAAFHSHELKPREETIINLDCRQRGLGSGSCGPHTLDQYQIPAGTYAFGYTLEISAHCPEETSWQQE